MLTPPVNITTTGGSGASAGSGTSGGIRGLALTAKITYNTQHANTDLTIAELGGLGRTLLTLTNVNTSGTYNLSVPVHDSTGAAVSGSNRPPYIDGYPLLITVAQGNDGAPGVTVVIQYMPD